VRVLVLSLLFLDIFGARCKIPAFTFAVGKGFLLGGKIPVFCCL
jgi:hypothetical protein